MMYRKDKKNISGIGIVEIIVGTGILTLALISVIVAFNLYFRAGIENTKKIQAAYLLEEGVEIIQYFRTNNWDVSIAPLSTSTPLRFSYNGLFWEATTSIAFIDGVFDRTIEIHDVYRRNSDSDIVASTSPDAKTLDPDARHMTAFVSWEVKHGSTVATTTSTLEAYIINFLE